MRAVPCEESHSPTRIAKRDQVLGKNLRRIGAQSNCRQARNRSCQFGFWLPVALSRELPKRSLRAVSGFAKL